MPAFFFVPVLGLARHGIEKREGLDPLANAKLFHTAPLGAEENKGRHQNEK